MQTDRATAKPRKARRVKPTVVAAPKGDVASSGADYGMKQASQAARSAPVKRAQRAVYDQQPAAQKQRIVKNATGAVKQNLAPVHAGRVARNQELAKSQAGKDTKGNQDRQRAADYLVAHPEVLHPSHPQHGSFLATITGAAKLGQAGAKLASDVAGTAAPYVAAAYMPALAATAHFAGVGKEASKIASNAGRDIVDIPANAPAALYKLGDTAIHDPKQAAKDLAQPYIDLAKHPIKSLGDHPVGSALLFSGSDAAVGRGVGKALRTAPSETLRKAGRTTRAPRPGPGNMAAVERVPRSPNTIHALAGDTKIGGKFVRKVRRASKPTMGSREINRRVDETFDAERNLAFKAEHKATKKARKVLKGADAGATLHAQGIVDGTRADLQRYLEEVRAAHPGLDPVGQAANEKLQGQIAASLKNYNEPRARALAGRYQELSAGHDAAIVGRNIVSAKKAEATRLVGPLARRNPDPALAQVAKKSGKRLGKARRQSNRMVLKEQIAKQAAGDAQTYRGGVGVPHAEMNRLINAMHDTQAAQAHVDALKITDAAAKSASKRSVLRTGEVPAYVSHAEKGDVRPSPVSATRPTLTISKARTAEAVRKGLIDAHPARLVEQAGISARRAHAADSFDRMLQEVGARDSPGGPVTKVQGRANARKAARRISTPDVAFTPVDVGKGHYALIPDTVHKRLAAHEAALGAKPGKSFGQAFTRSVLATSTKRAVGQATEAALRAGVAHAGPRSYITAHRVLKRLDAPTREMVKARTLSGGLPRQLQVENSVAHHGEVVDRANRFLDKPGPKQLRQVWNGWQNLVFTGLDKVVQAPFEKAMLGKAIRDQLMPDHVRKLSDKAIEDATRGLTHTNAQVDLGRELVKSWGKYSKFSPKMRATLGGYAPFAAWFLSATRFVYQVLPQDHPVATSVLASASQATEEWRKSVGLYYDPFSAKNPGWLQGSIPTKGGGHFQVGPFSPLGVLASDGGLLGSAASLVLPEAQGFISAAQGHDWKGKSLVKGGTPDARRAAAALASLGAAVPFWKEIVAATGVHTPDQADGSFIAPTAGARLARANNPLREIPASNRQAAGTVSGAGISKAELDQLAKEASRTGPQISKAELDALLREQRGKP